MPSDLLEVTMNASEAPNFPFCVQFVDSVLLLILLLVNCGNYKIRRLPASPHPPKKEKVYHN